MKKITIITLCLLALGTTVFAYDMSVGFGGVFGLVNDKWENRIYPSGDIADWYFKRMQYGGFAFFGTRYTDFNFTIKNSKNNVERIWKTGENAGETENWDEEYLVLSVGGYVKYPFSFKSIAISPTIGVDFEGVESRLYIWLRGGLGLDVFLTERFFIRGQALYGYGVIIPLPDDNRTIIPGHAPLFKLGLGWMF